jgi:hypothetical protein
VEDTVQEARNAEEKAKKAITDVSSVIVKYIHVVLKLSGFHH